MDNDVIILSTADWDNPFWTNKQHVATELARRGFRVLYIESIGLRRPTARRRDLTRILRRLIRSVRAPRRVHENIWVWSPLVLPAHGSALARRLNRSLMRAGIALAIKRARFSRGTLWTYNPLTTDLLSLSSFRAVVYHCVDDIKSAPGMPREAIQRAELQLVQRANVVFATARNLAETRGRSNPNTYYFSNVADYEHFARARDPITIVPDDLKSLPAPRIGFVGAISGYKLDFELLRKLAQARPDWSIVLIGEVGEGDPWTDISRIRGISNLHLLGPRPYRLLPAYLKGFRVGILPNLINDYTRSMFPMKFFEYMAAGLPVVGTQLPALAEHADVARLTVTPEEFIGAVESELERPSTPLEVRIERARQYTYAARTDAMLRIVTSVTSPPHEKSQRKPF